MISWGQPGLDPAADLERLDGQLGGCDRRTVLVTGQGRHPRLYVTRCPDHKTAAIAADALYYRWTASGVPIAPVTRPGQAAAAIAMILRIADLTTGI